MLFIAPGAVRAARAQPTASVIVEVTADGRPVAGAEIVVAARKLLTDRSGRATIAVEPGPAVITVRAPRFNPATIDVTAAEGAPAVLRVALVPLLEVEEEIVVSATRTDTRLQDQPVRVEVIDREEIEEKALMTPGSVAMLLGETTGLRVQTTAPSLGAGNVRIQGLRGRYAQLVADGLPLYGGQSDSFSLFQVPPLDLDRVEVIKGVASALYGASALGGVINLVSRRPRANEMQLLLNTTSQRGRDATIWVARAPVGGWSWSMLGGYHGQAHRDLDDDGWTDVPAFERGIVRPRLFFDNGRGGTLFVTLGAMAEDRSGGTIRERTAPDDRPFVEALDTRRADGGVVGRWLTGGLLFAVRGSAMRQSQSRVFGAVAEHGMRATWFGEASVQGARGRHTWVVGTAFQQDRFDLRELPPFSYRFSSPSIFAQDEVSLGPRLTLALSARTDVHSEYGALTTPRLSVLVRPAPGWIARLSVGTGAFAPTPFTETTEETGLSRVQPLRAVRAERARGASADLTRTVGPIEVTGTLFGSVVAHPLQQRDVDDAHVRLFNADGPTRSWGTELLARYRTGAFNALLTHAWTRSTERDPERSGRRDVPLTPTHAASFNVMWEESGRGRFGIETYYVGRQMLEDNPYRERGRPHLLLGALIERTWREARFFINSENLLNVRQTSFDPLIMPARAPDGRWTVDAWAPLDGRVFNGGVRIGF